MHNKDAKILFVDDNRAWLTSVCSQLQHRFCIETACKGQQALGLLTNAGPFAVVISNFHIEDINGLEFMKNVRQLSPDSICVMMTDFADMDTAVRAVNEGLIFRFLTKPCRCEDIVDTLSQCLARYRRIISMKGYTYTTYVENSKPVRTECSRSCLAVTGYSDSDFVSDNHLWFKMVLPEYRKMVTDAFQSVIAGDKVAPIEFKIRRSHGDIHWLRNTIIPHFDENGAIYRYEGFVEDVTEKKQMEDALRQSQAGYERMVANIPGIVFKCRLREDGTIEFLFLSHSCMELVGIEPEKVRHDSSLLMDRFLPADRGEFYRLLSESAHTFCSCRWTGRLTVNSQERWYQSVFRPGRTCDDGIVWDGLMLDITDIKRTESELFRINETLREHDRLKAEFVSTVSHELRTPLCIFKNIISNALAGVMGKISHRLYESLKMADASIDRLSRILSDFLDMSMIEAGKMKLHITPLPAQSLISEVVQSLGVLASVKKIQLKTVWDKKELVINADYDRIAQVLNNLIGNAIKFLPVNGHVEICMEDMPDEVEFSVWDDGPGLSKSEAEKVFNCFVQVHQLVGPGDHGTGLGLSIAREIVQLHGGRIWVESERGKGSCFIFTLPKSCQPQTDKTNEKQLVDVCS